uniref:PH domain-containing protein n=1 Tax=Homalodisca liturata TaxID=320908 RepID=A0A1B6IE89_9HEMI
MDFTERMLERNRSRYCKPDTKENTSQTAPLKEVHHNTVTTIASTSVDIKKNSGSNKVTIETTVTMRKVPNVTSNSSKEEMGDVEESTCTEGEIESTDEKENVSSLDEKSHMRQGTKSRLDRLGVFYSDDPTRLSSPIHRTEERFLAADMESSEPQRNDKDSGRSARLAALAETINNWEDDPRHIPLPEEAQGFARSESNKRLIYDYDNNDKPQTSQSPTKCSPITSRVSGSPLKSTSPLKTNSPIKATSPVKIPSPVKEPLTSPVKGRYGSPIQMGISTKPKGSQSGEEAIPTMGLKQLRSPRKVAGPVTPPTGSVLDRAQRYEETTSPTKRGRDPAELPLAERLALFERNAGAAVLPKAPLALPVPVKKLQQPAASAKPKLLYQKDSSSRLQPSQHSGQQNSGSTSSLHDRLALFERGADNSSKEHMKGILSEREKEMEMLKHRWDSNKGVDDFTPSAPPPTPPLAPPIPPSSLKPEHLERRHSGYYYEDDVEDLPQQISPQHEILPKTAYPILKDVKKVKLSPPKPGCLYPCLSDMETESSEAQESEIDNQNNRSSSSEMSNESEANSLGQDIVRISQSSLKRDWSACSDQSGNEDNMSNEIDDLIDEALEDSSDEPTPPKRISYSNIGSIKSTSFEYSQNKENQNAPSQPLLHTVSFYRKQQNMTLKPPSPSRHIQIDPSAYSTDDSIDRMEEELDRELKLVEQKIEMLQQEVKKQQTIISQSSQALNLCYSTIEFSGSTEQLEAEKLLLLASQRRQAALHEIQRLRVEQTIRPQSPGNKTLTERGSLTLSRITVPLRMDVIHQAAKDDQCYYLVCLVHSDERVLATDVMCAPRSLHSHNKLTFPNTLALEGLYSDFKVTLEVYTMTARSKEIIPHDVKYHINTSKKDASKLKLTPRKGKGDSRLMMPSVQSPGGPSAVRTSAFTMAGYVIFSLREIHRTQFALNKNVYTSVLEGSMHLKIDSEMSVDVEYRGFLTMFEDVSGFGAWHRRWCLLKGDKLSYWKYPDDERVKIALDTIELSTCITQEVDLVKRDMCARHNTFLLETVRPARSTDVDSLVLVRNGDQTIIKHLLSADTREERIQWCQHLNKALALMRAWGVTAK